MNILVHTILKKGIVKWGSTIAKNLPFIFFFSLCILPATLGMHLLCIYRGDSFQGWQYYCTALMYTQALLIAAGRSKVGKNILYLIGIALFFFFEILWLLFKATISPVIFQFLIETTVRESSEFVATYALSLPAAISYFGLLVLIIAILYSEYKWKRSKIYQAVSKSLSFTLYIGLASILIFIVGLYQLHTFRDMSKCDAGDLDHWAYNVNAKSMDAISASIYSCNTLTTVSREIKIAVENAQSVYKENLITDSNTIQKDSVYIIYILGESYIKSHASLYGYKRQTTPFMDQELTKGRLVAFTNMITPYNNTTNAQKNSFCCNSLVHGEKWYNTPYFPIIFKASGYKVTFWDNQRVFDIGAFYDFSANSFFYNNSIVKYAYNAISEKKYDYDGQLVDDFLQTEARKPYKRNLVMFHLLGQHVNYADRYPHNRTYTRFTKKGTPNKALFLTDMERNEIADYDNATYYNDNVIKKITSWYADKPTVLIYMSDHGEEVYDYRNSKGRVNPQAGLIKKAIQYQYEIPLVVWFSPKFMQSYPNVVKDVRKAKDKPYISDNICQLLFHVSGVHTSWHRPDRCPLCTSYKPTPRMISVMSEWKNYDKIVTNKH